MDKRIALVTGANRGLGLETARQLAQQDIWVIVSARDPEKLKATKLQFEKEGLDADFIVLDVTDATAINNTRQYLESRYPQLDILVNNAGITREMGAPPINNSAEIPIADVKAVFETNVFGVIALTQALLPLLKKSPQGRIVNLNSGLGSLTRHSDPSSPFYHLKLLAYNSSKTALNQFTVHLAEALTGTSIKVNSVAPGWVRTDLGGPYAPLSPAEGAQIIVSAATLPADGPTGQYFTHKMEPIPW